MIRCQLVKLSRNRRGHAVREAHAIHGESLRIGRAADNEIYLPDPRVTLVHARIVRGGDGLLYIKAERPSIFVDGGFESRVRLLPERAVTLGPYRFTVEAAEWDSDITLTMELVSPLPDDRSGLMSRSRTTLAAAGMSKRAAAGLALAVILLPFLVLPLLPSLVPSLRQVSAALPIGLDQSWNPGPLSPGHNRFARDCQSCHQQPFVQVQDAACTACHQEVGDHLGDKHAQQALFGGVRCASCHKDHQGDGLAQRDPSLCIDCHHAGGKINGVRAIDF